MCPPSKEKDLLINFFSEKDLKDMFDENKSLLKKIIKLRRSYGFIENASKEIGYTTLV